MLRVFAGLLALTALPGFEELVEDLVHYLSDGHTAHDAGHEDEQAGHCCSGLFHTCACHPHAPALAGSHAHPGLAMLRWPSPSSYGGTGPRIVHAPGHRTQPFRPPSV